MRHKLSFISLILGINSGLSYSLLVATFTTYLQDMNIGLEMIGILSLRTIPYSFKFLWSPLVDNLRIKFLPSNFGLKKGWLVTMQLCLVIAIITVGLIDVEKHLYITCLVASLAALCAATYDIAMDSYRIELNNIAKNKYINSFVVLGFRAGFLISGAFAIYLSTLIAWKWVFVTVAIAIIPCMIIIFFYADSLNTGSHLKEHKNLQHWFKKNVIKPFTLIKKLPSFYLILLVVSLYKVSDGYLDTMLIPFILDSNFSKADLATFGITIGFVFLVLGTFIGSYFIKGKYVSLNNLIIAEILAAFSNLLFILLVMQPGNKILLMTLMSIESFCTGICNITLITYMTSLCKYQRFTATHYAIFISISGLGKVILGSTSGMVATYFGWTEFFIVSTLLSIPSLICIFLMKRKTIENSKIVH